MARAASAVITALAVCGLTSTAHPAILQFSTPVEPPAQYLQRGLAICDWSETLGLCTGPVMLQQEPLDQVNALCGAASGAVLGPNQTITACSLSDPTVGWFLIIIIDQQFVTPEFWQGTLHHELGHVGGWSHCHCN